jgi:hypothetical protein
MSNQPNKRGRGRPPKNTHTAAAAIHPPQNDIPIRFAPPLNIQTEPKETDDMAAIMQQIHDNEIAMAIDESIASNIAITGEHFQEDTDLERILYQIQQQEKGDAELARQLAEEENPPPNEVAQGDDMDEVLEQIRKMEAQEMLKKNGNAYDKPLNVDRLMRQQDAEDEELRKHSEWQSEKLQQDWEYEEALRQETMRLEALKKLQTPAPVPTPVPAPVPITTPVVVPVANTSDELEDIPKTREEMRAARMKFFNKLMN